MPTSRPIREGDRLTEINDTKPGRARLAIGNENTQAFVLQDDFGLTRLRDKSYQEAVCYRVFGISNCTDFRDPRLTTAITNRTAPGLYVREGDDTSNWEAYRQVLARRVAEAIGGTSVAPAQSTEQSPPPPTRFNLLECDLPAVPPTRADHRLSDELAELQASFRAARAARIAQPQPVLTRFDLLECDEPAVPVTVKPQPSAPPQRAQPSAPTQQLQPQRRTVEDILDLTTSGPLEALAALQIVKAEIVRDLWKRETN